MAVFDDDDDPATNACEAITIWTGYLDSGKRKAFCNSEL
jgi:hypothetical protein